MAFTGYLIYINEYKGRRGNIAAGEDRAQDTIDKNELEHAEKKIKGERKKTRKKNKNKNMSDT